MDRILPAILNMSLTGAFVIVVICLLRLPLKKAPKIISYCLWAVAGLRLVLPFSIESAFGLVPLQAQAIPADALMRTASMGEGMRGTLPATALPYTSGGFQTPYFIGMLLWISGATAMAVFGLVSLLRLQQRVKNAVPVESNIFEAANIASPFALGVIRPKIYLPPGLAPGERQTVISHERTHIRRHDPAIKLAAYCILCLHWFNPLAWLAFMLMSADMEMACDERVISETGGAGKRDYSILLLSLASEKQYAGIGHPAFGGGRIKQRVKNIMRFKKPSRLIVVAVVLLVSLVSAGLLLNKEVIYGNHLNTTTTYNLENAATGQQQEKPSSITLHKNGRAELTLPPGSGYTPTKCVYTINDGQVIITDIVQESALPFDPIYGLHIATFALTQDNTLILVSSGLLNGDGGTRYAPQ